MLTGTDVTALSKKKLFRSELDHRFGFSPFYGTDNTRLLLFYNVKAGLLIKRWTEMF
jgi:hypothetical protein